MMKTLIVGVLGLIAFFMRKPIRVSVISHLRTEVNPGIEKGNDWDNYI